MMDEALAKIESFLSEHHLLSLATQGETLRCCSLFYVYDATQVAFIVATDPQTQHGINVMRYPNIAGTVALETKMVGKIQGIQFSGIMSQENVNKELYFKTYPYALAMNPTLWIIRLDEIKFTDNRLGFGKKLTWKREQF